MDKRDWWAAPEAASLVKRDMVVDYFRVWSTIVGKAARRGPLWYVDLFAGRGSWLTGEPSTPLLIAQHIAGSPELRERMGIHLNERDARYAEALSVGVAGIIGEAGLRYGCDVTARTVGLDGYAWPEGLGRNPGLLFLDPWGLKGITRRLISEFIREGMRDVIVFFSLDSTRRWMKTEQYRPHLEALFGNKGAAALAQTQSESEPGAFEALLLGSAVDALKIAGAKYVTPFAFGRRDSEATSHYLLFATKHPKGDDLAKDLAKGHASHRGVNVRAVGFHPSALAQPDLPFDPVTELADLLEKDMASCRISMGQLYEEHGRSTQFTRGEYKHALRSLEEQRRIAAEPPMHDRRGVFPDTTIAIFPPKDD